MNVDWTVKVTDIAIIFATLVGPIIAIWASEWRQKNRQNQERKEWVFRTLMTTRSARLNPEHIQALNYITFAFAGQLGIVDAWGLYFAHLHTDHGMSTDSNARWHDKSNGLLAELLHQMAQHLKIVFSKTDIAQASYYPRGYEVTETERQELRQLLLQVLRNERSINMNASFTYPPKSSA